MLAFLAAPAAGFSAPNVYDGQRAANIGRELLSRAGLGGFTVNEAPLARVEPLKSDVLSTLAPFGDPALRLPADVRDRVDELCSNLESMNPTAAPATAGISSADGRWQVRFSDAPPPSNGALGPLRGAAFQIIDVASKSYVNELSLFGGALTLSLAADFEPSGDASLRVAFRTITIALLGAAFPPITFPAGTERTWLLTYVDSDTRIVRAGVDGGRSTARELGLIDEDEGQAADAYLFYMTRAAAPPPPFAGLRAAGAKRSALKAQLLQACEGQRLGADTTDEQKSEISALMAQLAECSPTADPASSRLLRGRWDIVWTTEAELLFLTAKGFLGLPCVAAYQTISTEPDGQSQLGNRIEFDNGAAGGSGFLNVGSSCEPAAEGGRVDFRFSSCAARWRQLEVPLPPVGTGWFEVIYLDEALRLARDSRGDLQICRRGRP